MGLSSKLTIRNPLNNEEQIIEPFNIQLVLNFDQNSQLFAITAINPGQEILVIPQIIRNILTQTSQGKIGKGNFLIEGEDFSSKELIFTNQVHLYTDKINFDKTEVKSLFKKIGLKLIIKEFGANYKLEARLALVVGISDYKHASKLRNPVNDAVSIDLTLKSLGFETILATDLSQKELKMKIDDFGDQLENSDVGLFFFAGHGIQSAGVNYLIPKDANLKKESQLEYDSVKVDRVLAMMQNNRTKLNIIILDACRDNPFRGWKRNLGSGLAPMDSPKGSFIAFATSPNSTASDGDGNNGLYTSKILKHIVTPNLQIEHVFKRIRIDVEKESDGEQIPWETTSLTGEFYFKK